MRPKIIKKIAISLIFISLSLTLIILHKSKNSLSTATKNIEKLISLPYINYVKKEKNKNKSGVTTYNRLLSEKGLNLLTSVGTKKTHLIDMEGNILHTWSAKTHYGWQHVEIDNQGNLFVEEGTKTRFKKSLWKLNWDSTVEWVSKEDHHHDIALRTNGDIITLTKSKHYINYNSRKIPILDNYITILSPDGKVKSKTSLYDLIIKNKKLELILNAQLNYFFNKEKENLFSFPTNIRHLVKYFKIKTTGPDVFHANTIELINTDIGIAKKGELLISLNNFDTIIIINSSITNITWHWRSEPMEKVHTPTILKNKNILFFDNGHERLYSKIIELDPRTEKIIWEYKANPPQLFFSKLRGSCQPLNQNILVTESNAGHAFEITKTGKIVWDFWNPHHNSENKRTQLYRLTRLLPKTLKKITFPDNFKEKLKALGYLE